MHGSLQSSSTCRLGKQWQCHRLELLWWRGGWWRDTQRLSITDCNYVDGGRGEGWGQRPHSDSVSQTVTTLMGSNADDTDSYCDHGKLCLYDYLVLAAQFRASAETHAPPAGLFNQTDRISRNQTKTYRPPTHPHKKKGGEGRDHSMHHKENSAFTTMRSTVPSQRWNAGTASWSV